MKSGQFVEWDSSGGTARGKIVSIIRNGDVPNIDAKITGTPEAPAARIQIYKKDDDGNYEATDTYVGHKLTELRGIKSLSSLEELSPRQYAIVESLIQITDEYGKFDWGVLSEGSHYTPPELNPFKAQGLICENCAFYAYDSQSCAIVEGVIAPDAICKFWVIENEDLINESPEETE